MILKIFNIIIDKFTKSKKSVFSKQEVIDTLILIRSEQMTKWGKEEQEKTWKIIKEQKNVK